MAIKYESTFLSFFGLCGTVFVGWLWSDGMIIGGIGKVLME
jgi:hypothetical protein